MAVNPPQKHRSVIFAVDLAFNKNLKFYKFTVL